MKRPLVIVSGLKASEAEFVLPWLLKLKRPMCLEGTSRLRGHPDLVEWELRGGEKSVAQFSFDGVIRIGNVPTLRFWRDLEVSKLPVLNFSNVPLSGLPRVNWVQPLQELGALQMRYEEWDESERRTDRQLHLRLSELVNEFPLSEPGWVHSLSRQIPSHARLFLGNSLPIREWDLCADYGSTRDIFANRGTNGIDGLVATFCGVCEYDRPNFALLGDLSVLYDLSGPWALNERPVSDFHLLIMNNGGGQIFRRMFHNSLFLNRHELRFQGWADMWKMRYVLLEDEPVLAHGEGPRVIEILPSHQQTEAFWAEWKRL